MNTKNPQEFTLMSDNEEKDRLAIDGGAPSRQRKDPPMYPGGMMIDAE